MKDRGVKPSKITLPPLIEALSANGRVREALEVFEDRLSLGIPHDAFLYNCMLWSVARRGDLRQARRMLEEMVGRGEEPNEMTFMAMLNCIAVKQKVSAVLDLVRGRKVVKGRDGLSVKGRRT